MNTDAAEYIIPLLEGNASDELALSYLKICEILESVNYTGHLESLMDLYNAHASQIVDNCGITPLVDRIIREHVDAALNMVGIVVTEDIRLPMLTDLLTIVLQFDPTDTPEFILEEINGSDDPVDALIGILSIYGDEDYETWMTVIESVSESTIRRMEELCVRVEHRLSEVDANPVDRETRRRLMRMTAMAPDSLGADVVRTSGGNQVSFEANYNLHVSKMLDMRPVDAIDAIYSLAAVSKEGSSMESYLKAVNYGMDDLFYDARMRMEAEQLRKGIEDKYISIIKDKE